MHLKIMQSVLSSLKEIYAVSRSVLVHYYETPEKIIRAVPSPSMTIRPIWAKRNS